jgi:hypothetical protein
MGFCLLFDDVGNRFILAGDDEYNYCRKEPGGFKPPGFGKPSSTALS